MAESGYELFTGSLLRLLRLKFVAFAEKYDVSGIHVGNMGQVSENEYDETLKLHIISALNAAAPDKFQ